MTDIPPPDAASETLALARSVLSTVNYHLDKVGVATVAALNNIKSAAYAVQVAAEEVAAAAKRHKP